MEILDVRPTEDNVLEYFISGRNRSVCWPVFCSKRAHWGKKDDSLQVRNGLSSVCYGDPCLFKDAGKLQPCSYTFIFTQKENISGTLALELNANGLHNND
jgi:hypothetical protein